MRGFGLPAWCRKGLCSSVLLRSLCWYLFTDVTGQHIGPVFKSQAVLKSEDGVDRLLFQSVGKQLNETISIQPRRVKMYSDRVSNCVLPVHRLLIMEFHAV